MPQASFTLGNQIALVTGASSGIGRAIALRLAEMGAEAHLVARRRERLLEVEKEIRARGGRAAVHSVDLTQDDELTQLRKAMEQVGRLDVLVLSSGAIRHGTIDAASVADFDLQYRSNVLAPYALIQALLPLLRQQRGHVVFINSSASGRVSHGAGQYAATQHAFRAIADSLREEVNAEGIRVTSIYPGRTATPRTAALFEAEGRAYRPELLMQPEDVASMVGHALTLPRTAEVTDISMRSMLKSY